MTESPKAIRDRMRRQMGEERDAREANGTSGGPPLPPRAVRVLCGPVPCLARTVTNLRQKHFR